MTINFKGFDLNNYLAYLKFPVLSADSQIEEMFIKKCIDDKKNISLALEWANSKEIYCKYTRMIFCTHGNYSKHDSTHSIAILSGIFSVLGKDNIENLSVMDLWMLLHCAYAHDIGMPYSHQEAIDLWNSLSEENSDFSVFIKEAKESEDEDLQEAVNKLSAISRKIGLELTKAEKDVYVQDEYSYDWAVKVSRYVSFLTAEFCRKKHADRTAHLLMDHGEMEIYTASFTVDNRFYKLIAKCSGLHAESFDEIFSLPKREWSKYGKAHPRFIAVMLRLGDLLDIDNNRFDPIVLKFFGDLTETSRIHLEKHKSITHILLDVNKIEVVARSDKEDVCRCACVWFKYLNNEVQNLINNWSTIAPTCLGGCKFSLPKTEVYFKEQLFTELEEFNFKVDKSTLIDLVIGRNLYTSKFDFIREYIQNALDAMKMKFWLEVEEDRMSMLSRKEEQSQVYSCTPFDFNYSYYEKYSLEITLQWIDADIPKIRVTIADKGIGVDKECLEAISHIGAGWKKRKKYKGKLENMPEWLRPTGGFGIGMQSGFMIADEIRIRTKCIDETEGREIILYSPSKSGRIEVRRGNVAKKGTSIAIDLPYTTFLDYKNKYPFSYANQYKDFFGHDDILNEIEEFIRAYINYIAENSLFPIIVKKVHFKSRHFLGIMSKGELTKCFEKIDAEEEKKQRYIFRKEKIQKVSQASQYTEQKIFVWKRKGCVLFTIGPMKSAFKNVKQIKWFYKGIRVFSGTRIQNSSYAKLMQCLGDVSVDIMGIPVKECLTVDRNQFNQEFDLDALLDDFLREYYKCYYKEYFFEIKDYENILFYRQTYYQLILGYFYIDDSNFRKQIIENLKQKNDECLIDVLQNTEPFLWTRRIDCYKIEDKSEDGQVHTKEITRITKIEDMTFLKFCYKLWKEENIEKYIILKQEQEIDTKYFQEGEIIIADSMIYNIFALQEDFSLKKNGAFEVLRKKVGEKETNIDDQFLKTSLDDDEKRKIFLTKDAFCELHVSELPFECEVKNMGNTENVSMIISPIPPMYTNTSLLNKMIGSSENPRKAFHDLIENGQEFKLLLNWVYDHQFVKKKYKREEIMKKYIELIDLIFTIHENALVEE